MARRHTAPREPDPRDMTNAKIALDIAQRELVGAVRSAAQAEQVSRWHIQIRHRNGLGPAFAAEYARTR
jgi:hypothetical protein